MNMPTYGSIRSPFTRDEKTHAWNLGDWSTEEFALLRDVTWTWTEKLDGTNVRIGWRGSEVLIGGRTDNAQMPPHLLAWITTNLPARKMLPVFGSGANVTIYGEGIGEQIQKSGGLYGGVRVVIFDVLIDGIWLKRSAVEKIASDLGVKVAPIVLRGTIRDAIDWCRRAPNSVVSASPMQAEGLVGRLEPELLDRRGERIIVKVKVRDVEKIGGVG